MPLTHLRTLSLIGRSLPHSRWASTATASHPDEDHTGPSSSSSADGSSSSSRGEGAGDTLHHHPTFHRRHHPSDRKGKSRIRDEDYRFPTRGSNGGPPDPFEVLGLGRTASQAEIKAQYYRLALILHPDSTHPSSSTANFGTLNRAYTLLTTPASRDTYLQSGSGWSGSSSRSFTIDPMLKEVLRRQKEQAAARARGGEWGTGPGGAGGRGGMGGYERTNAEAGRGAWGAFGVDGKWHAFPDATVGNGEPKYMSHERFVGVLVVIGVALGWIQYHRLDMVADVRRAEMDAAHLDASHALAAARREAQIHGHERRENIRRKVTESKVLREVEKMEQDKGVPPTLPAIAAPEST